MVVGDVELLPFLDALGPLGELAELYPEVSEADWEPYRARYPELFTGGQWRLPILCFLVRSGDETVLVDTGAGAPGHWEGWEPERGYGLPAELRRYGVEPEDVERVFLTHLHVDHIGWNPAFPRARFVVHEDAFAFAAGLEGREDLRRCVVDLADRFDLLTAETELLPGVVAFPTPGHYPGHMSLRAASGGAEAVVLGDAAVHPALLVEPAWRYVSDHDAERSARTRHELLAGLDGGEVIVACGHYPGNGIGTVRDGVWEPLS